MHMKRILLFLPLFLLVSMTFQATGSFRSQQKKIAKVKTSYSEKWPGITKRLKELNLDSSSINICIRAFKKEGQLEVWVKSFGSAAYQLYTTYEICQGSGVLGPKRCQGDGQVPEGFYTVNIFNPYSSYYLSLGVSYPNASDRFFACKRDPGGAIMIHGSCVTIGCIPLTDDKIKELYVLAVEAKNNGQQHIPIHIFPARLSSSGLAGLLADESYKEHHAFWKNLKSGYDYFEEKKIAPKVTIDAKGVYSFN
ncbi:MAG: hypothetical protein FD123_3296 [Bacteroidetes bacterium]|nr:MAG: hypothetical protein FD123_3296 [Bacteroidota bacterium]